MTSKEAAWVVKKNCMGQKIVLVYKGIRCRTVNDEDLKTDLKFLSENNFMNPYKGLYLWYNKDGEVHYTICVRDANAIYQCSIENVEIENKEQKW